MNHRALALAFTLVAATATGCATQTADESESPDEPTGEQSSAQVVCRFEVDDKIPVGDYNGVVELNGSNCGSWMRITYSGYNGQYIDVEATQWWGQSYGHVRLERTSYGYRERFVSGNYNTVKGVQQQIAASKNAGQVVPKPGTSTNWNCVGAVASFVGGIFASVGGCATPVVNGFVCGGAIVCTLGAAAWVKDAC